MPQVKVLVTGSRTWTDLSVVRVALADVGATHVAQGGANGADTLAYMACTTLHIPCTTYPADWNKHGRKAGPIRNLEMLEQFKPDVVLAFWDGQSVGTAHMIAKAREYGFRVIVYKQHAGHGIVRMEYAVTQSERPPLFL